MVSCAQRCRDFGLVLFNPKEKTCLRRTCKSWTLIIIYFCIFYSCLAAYFVGVLSAIVYGITDPKVPTLTGMQSLLKLSPGLGVLPPVDPEATLMQVPVFDSKQRTEYLAYMEEYLKQYKNESTNCNFVTGDRDNWSPDVPCEFPLELLGPCATPAKYMEENNNICIYLKMNKIYGYLPDVPDKKVLVQCGPATSFDGENLNSPVFFPSVVTENGTFGYFSSVSFPYLNQPGFQVPLLAVTFPEVRKNTVVMVSCTLSNVETSEPLRFDLSIDDVKSIAFQ